MEVRRNMVRKTVSINLTEKELELLEELKNRLGLRHYTEVIRMAIRLAYRHYFPEERPQR